MKLILILINFFLFAFSLENGFGENFYNLNKIDQKKTFFRIINQMLDISCENVIKEREFVIAFLNQSAKNAYRIENFDALKKLVDIKNKYKIQNLFDQEEYKIKLACIPKSMALAQAFVESAGGNSRFAKEANNLFGEWTWGEKGIIPLKRSKGKTHKIKIFDTLQDSVDSYVLNLNRHFAYDNFRRQRQKFINDGKNFSGLDAIKAMNAYSELKQDYVRLITKIIKQYKLCKYD